MQTGPALAEVGKAVPHLGTETRDSTEGKVLCVEQQSRENERNGHLCDGANACHTQGILTNEQLNKRPVRKRVRNKTL